MPAIPDAHRDLLGADFATLATIGPHGFPQLSEIWFLADDDGIAMSLNTARQKTKNLLREPHCTLFVLDLENPYHYLEIRARAEITPDGDYAFASLVGHKYGADLRDHDGPGESRVAVHLVPTRVNAVKMR